MIVPDNNDHNVRNTKEKSQEADSTPTPVRKMEKSTWQRCLTTMAISKEMFCTKKSYMKQIELMDREVTTLYKTEDRYHDKWWQPL